jgi:hypothetical protein
MSEDWKQVQAFTVPIHDFDKEPELIGKYVECKEITGGYQTSQYIIELPDGSKEAVWGSYQVNQFMNEIEVGSEVKIVFTGRQDIGEGKSVKQFEIFTK